MAEDIEDVVNIFKALACETRLKIVIGLLDKKECNVNLMSEKLGLAQPNVSQHLTILKNAGIIEGYRKGKQICYKIVDEKTEQIIKALKIKCC
jgi:ArsR family transcriptional regulator